jgi:SP family facilitated glucose transporter-like MFS transporter 1
MTFNSINHFPLITFNIFVPLHFIYQALRRLRASNQVEEDIEEMRAEERAQQAESSISIMELICSPTLRAPLIIGIVMQLSQQLSGINAVSFYSLHV